MEKGTLKVRNSGSAFIKENKKPVPKEYTPLSKDYNGVECEYETNEKGNITKLFVDGNEISPNKEKLKEKEERQKKAEAKQKAEELRLKEIEANKELIDFYKNDFAKADKAFLPNDTLDILMEDEWKIDNFALRLNKLARFEKDERDFSKSKFQFFKTNRRNIDYEPKYKFDEKFISQINTTNLNAAKDIFGSNIFDAKLSLFWRMAVGLGNESVYETSITLHHIYGIPYIPASSIKGIVRSYIIQEYFDNGSEEPAEYRALHDETFCKIFGTAKETKIKNKNGKEFKAISPLMKDGKPTDHIGLVTFFDAFPTQEPKIEPDIMNVHYPDYYNGSEPPTDYQNPNPIPFLTVKDTPFQFIIGSKKEKLENLKIGNKTITDWLIEALQNNGIGAKTAVGYGRMH